MGYLIFPKYKHPASPETSGFVRLAGLEPAAFRSRSRTLYPLSYRRLCFYYTTPSYTKSIICSAKFMGNA